jgi:epoxyqueuosine reductase
LWGYPGTVNEGDEEIATGHSLHANEDDRDAKPGSTDQRFDASALKTEAIRLGFELVGVCPPVAPPHIDAYEQWLAQGFGGEMRYLERHLPLKRDPRSLLPGTESVVVVGLNYNQERPRAAEGPGIAKYALGRDYHRVLRSKLAKLARWLAGEHPGSVSRACVDSAPIMERDYGQLAGLGWFGKNTMLINSERGSWFFLGVLLTTVRFEVDRPSEGGCGTCNRCLEACPTGAIVNRGGRWQVDARRCISYLTIEHPGPIDADLRSAIGGWTIGCDVCQDVCPFNTERGSQPLRAVQTGERDFAAREWPTLLELASISDSAWDALTRGSATRRVSAAMLRRNARINLENLT